MIIHYYYAEFMNKQNHNRSCKKFKIREAVILLSAHQLIVDLFSNEPRSYLRFTGIDFQFRKRSSTTLKTVCVSVVHNV